MSDELDPQLLGEYQYAIQQITYHRGDVRRWIIYAGDQLEMAGYPKDKISTKLRNDLPEMSANYISTICSEKDWTDKRFSISEAPISEPQISSTLHDEDGALPCENPEKITIEAENRDYIDHLQQKIEFMMQIQKKLRVKPFLSLLEREQYEEYIMLSNKIQEMASQAWDDRYSIPVFTQFYLAQMLNTSSIKHSATEYMAKVKAISKLSSKQVTKTLKGIVTDVHYFYEPTSQLEALIDGFYGKRCEKCQSWRVKWENGFCHCFACRHEYKVKAEKLPLARDQAEVFEN